MRPLMLAAAMAAALAQTHGTPERFTALAVNMGSPPVGRPGATVVEIRR